MRALTVIILKADISTHHDPIKTHSEKEGQYFFNFIR